MTDLYLHSLTEFAETILECLRHADARHIVEIGAETGGMTRRLADFAGARGGRLTSIDPLPSPDFHEWASCHPHLDHLADTSLSAMPHLSGVDAWVIDGDHNYYTVFHELCEAERQHARDGTPLLAFLHDVSWPCARRDMYYAPDDIPSDWRHPYSYEGGVTLGNPGLLPLRGLRGMGHFAFAAHEGGPRNGVLTAVEDFLKQARARGADLAFAFIPAVLGLGVVFDASAPWASKVAEVLVPLHDNPLLARLEENRLRNYLAVLEWQDRGTMSHAA